MHIKWKNFIICASIALVMLGIAAAIIVGYISNKYFSYEIPTGGAKEQNDLEINGNSFNLLLVCVDDINFSADKNAPAFALLVRFDKERREVTYTSFADNTLFERASEKSGLLSDIYKDEGVETLCREIRSSTGIGVDRYIVFTTGFVSDLVDTFGTVNFNVPCQMNFGDGKSVGRGMQSVGGSAAARIVTFNAYENTTDSRRSTVAEFMRVLFSKVLDTKNLQRRSELCTLLSGVQTDILPKEVEDNKDLIFSYTKLSSKILDVSGNYEYRDGKKFFMLDTDATVDVFGDYRKIYN